MHRDHNHLHYLGKYNININQLGGKRLMRLRCPENLCLIHHHLFEIYIEPAVLLLLFHVDNRTVALTLAIHHHP